MTQGDQELAVWAISCVEPVPDCTLIRARQLHYGLYACVGLVVLAVERLRDRGRNGPRGKSIARKRLNISVLLRKRHP